MVAENRQLAAQVRRDSAGGMRYCDCRCCCLLRTVVAVACARMCAQLCLIACPVTAACCTCKWHAFRCAQSLPAEAGTAGGAEEGGAAD